MIASLTRVSSVAVTVARVSCEISKLSIAYLFNKSGSQTTSQGRRTLEEGGKRQEPEVATFGSASGWNYPGVIQVP